MLCDTKKRGRMLSLRGRRQACAPRRLERQTNCLNLLPHSWRRATTACGRQRKPWQLQIMSQPLRRRSSYVFGLFWRRRFERSTRGFVNTCRIGRPLRLRSSDWLCCWLPLSRLFAKKLSCELHCGRRFAGQLMELDRILDVPMELEYNQRSIEEARVAVL